MPSTLTVIGLTDRKLAIHLKRVWWRPNIVCINEKAFVPDAMKKIGNIKRDHSTLTV